MFQLEAVQEDPMSEDATTGERKHLVHSVRTSDTLQLVKCDSEAENGGQIDHASCLSTSLPVFRTTGSIKRARL